MSDRNADDFDEETLPPSASPRIEQESDIDAPTIGSDESASRDLRTSSSGLSVPGYELLEELGRGGMGVVYKARDESLDRTVALKMIIAGKLASTEDVRRFQLEAEAAAKLDHPGIVPIYDIGEFDSNHFFSMKFIDGGSLSDRSDEFKNDLRRAVELLRDVAKAVHHAHQRGVLHRDLKPGNILVTEEGKPLLTDLGLAKRLDDDSELTRTGLIMGTPGFMAPEQASGEKEITTAADIFSLGAILHWLVTGEAPFRGDTPLQVIMQTIEGQASSMRLSSPNIDVGLELICQKCLQKDPDQRYDSAASLANDLQAWLDGEPLTVRPPSPVALAAIWFRKNLRTVVGAVACGLACGGIVGFISLMGHLHRFSGNELDLRVLEQATGSQWPIGYTAFNNVPYIFLDFAHLAIFFIVFATGLISTLLVRPKSLEAVTVYSLTMGLLAGVIAHPMGMGWGPVSGYSVSKGSADVSLLASALYSQSETEHDLTRRALEQRYPGPSNVDERTRATLVWRKVMHDQQIGIPWGMWIGITLTLLLVTLPLTFCTIGIGALWVAGKRGFEFFGLSCERSSYTILVFMFLAIILPNGGPISAGPMYQTAVMAALAFALLAAIRNSHGAWRLVGFLAVVAAVIFSIYETTRISFYEVFAQNADTRQKVERAAALCGKYVEQRPREYDRFRSGILWLSAGREDEYATITKTMIDDFENAYQPLVADRLAKVALLRPDLQDPNDLPMIYELADFASAFGSDVYSQWFFFCRSLSELRQGNSAEALEWNRKCRDKIGDELKRRADLAAATFAVDSLAHSNAGDVELAKTALQQANAIAAKFNEEGWIDSWENIMFFQILNRQAKSQLGEN